MPELPEVEHYKRFLDRVLVGRQVARAEADPTPLLKGKTTPKLFAEKLAGRTAKCVERNGKLLIVRFDEHVVLVSHLGMSGKWSLRKADEETPPRSRARLFLDDGHVLDDVDTRMLGRLEVLSDHELARRDDLRSTGLDPLRDGLDPHRLGALFGKTSRPIKVVLMDASVIAGIGNIQATEALFRAGIHPKRPASSLAPNEIAALAEGILATIEHTLAAQAHEDEIIYLSEKKAGARNPFLIYGRVGKPCPRCGAKIAAVSIAARTSAYCPRCQPATRSGLPRGRG